MRKLALLSLVAAMALSACGGSNASPTPGGGAAPSAGGSCSYWCGTGSATVTVDGTSTTVASGGCLVQSAAVDARFGDWWNGGTATAEVAILAYKTDSKAPTISGKVGSTYFVLGTDATATVGADGSGTFSGTNSIGTGKISGTWTCQ